MRNRGQAATEYLATYGWAILGVMIAVAVLWQLGIFDFGGMEPPGKSGFSTLVPSDWRCSNNVMTLWLINSAGETLNNVTISGNPCAPNNLDAGGMTVCSTSADCPSGSGKYQAVAIVSYKAQNATYQSSGEIWGSAE